MTEGRGARSLRCVHIRDLRLLASIGAHAHERRRRQPVIINLEVGVRAGRRPARSLDDVVCYGSLADTIRAIVAEGHIDLVEQLAEKIAEAILADRRIERVRIRVDKPQAVAGAAAAGVEIERRRQRKPQSRSFRGRLPSK
jgi:dihydroneopterin aldolase